MKEMVDLTFEAQGRHNHSAHKIAVALLKRINALITLETIIDEPFFLDNFIEHFNCYLAGIMH
jgi:hypothetical protein